MAKRNPSNWTWRGLNIVGWNTISFKELIKTPTCVLKSMASANWPVRVLENNILCPELEGIWESIETNGIIKLSVKAMDPLSTKRSKHYVITLDETSNISVGLPVFA